jgi:outer membrane protein assembly factor BamE (lipoprotein component of BamABCDE complex)
MRKSLDMRRIVRVKSQVRVMLALTIPAVALWAGCGRSLEKPLIVFVASPSEPPKDLRFAFEIGMDRLQSLKSGVYKLRKGATRDTVRAALGSPSREDLSSTKAKPNEINGYLFSYDVRIVDKNTSNRFDQQLVLNFDRMGGLEQIISTVPEIK